LREIWKSQEEGRVIATEKESGKAEKARAYWMEVGEECVSRYIELREGDLLETSKRDVPVIDLASLDSRISSIFTIYDL